MAPPHQTGVLTLSFVGVPGSGSNMFAKPEICNLSRASNMAASVAVPQNLPQSTNMHVSNLQPKRLDTRNAYKIPNRHGNSRMAASLTVPHNLPPSTNVLESNLQRKRLDTRKDCKRPILEGIIHRSTRSYNEAIERSSNLRAVPSGYPIVMKLLDAPAASHLKLWWENGKLCKRKKLLQRQVSLLKQLMSNPKKT